MKTEIHPEYKEVTIRCACGESVTTRSTKGDANGELRVDICSKCILSSPESRSLLMPADVLISSRSVSNREENKVLLPVINVREKSSGRICEAAAFMILSDFFCYFASEL